MCLQLAKASGKTIPFVIGNVEGTHGTNETRYLGKTRELGVRVLSINFKVLVLCLISFQKNRLTWSNFSVEMDRVVVRSRTRPLVSVY